MCVCALMCARVGLLVSLCPCWKCIPGTEAGCGPSSLLGDALGRAKIFRPIGAKLAEESSWKGLQNEMPKKDNSGES